MMEDYKKRKKARKWGDKGKMKEKKVEWRRKGIHFEIYTYVHTDILMI